MAQFIGENNKLSGKVIDIKGEECLVELGDGTQLKADKVNVSAVGDKTTLSLRPERVEFDTHDAMDNLVNGRIEELIYLGDHIRVRMNVCGNDEFIVKVRNRGEKRKLHVGDTVPVGWALNDCKALDAVV